jgi:hypothetical protein
MEDPSPITIESGASVLYGSKIFATTVKSYFQRDVPSSFGSDITLSEFEKFIGVDRSDYVVRTDVGTDTLYTPFGIKTDGRKFTGTSVSFGTNLAASIGDLLVYSVFMRVDYNGDNNTILQIRNESSVLIGQVSDPKIFERTDSAGRWALCQFAVVVTDAAATSLLFNFINVSGAPADAEIASVSVRNYGEQVAGVNKEIFPICAI